MSEIYAHRTYEVTFNNPKYNATYNFIREKSGAFQYGNQTSVVILRGDEMKDIIDTRYDPLVMKNFDQWCEEWLKTAFRKDLEPKWEKMKGQPYFA